MKLASLESLPDDLRNVTEIRQLAADRRLFRPGDRATSFFLIVTGKLRLIRRGNKQVTTLQFLQAGNILGEEALFCEYYLDSAIAFVPSEVIVFPKQVLLSSLREYPDLAEDLLEKLIAQIQSLRVSLELRDIRSAHQRVLRYFQYLNTQNNQNIINLDQPLKDIAVELGFSSETIPRALSRLEQEGTIIRQQNRITLVA